MFLVHADYYHLKGKYSWPYLPNPNSGSYQPEKRMTIVVSINGSSCKEILKSCIVTVMEAMHGD